MNINSTVIGFVLSILGAVLLFVGALWSFAGEYMPIRVLWLVKRVLSTLLTSGAMFRLDLLPSGQCFDRSAVYTWHNRQSGRNWFPDRSKKFRFFDLWKTVCSLTPSSTWE